MAFVDFHFVWSGKYANLKDPTKILLYVIAAVCNHQTGEFYHSVPTLAHLAGISERSTRYALQELEQYDPPIVSQEPQDGKPSIKTHLPTAAFNRPAPHAGGPAPHAGVPLQEMQGNNRGTTTEETTTAADRISLSLIRAMTDLYGAEAVSRVVVAMKSMNGEVKNANAYFRVCCEKNWIPTNKKARQREEKLRREEARRRQQEQQQEEFDRMVREREEADPEVARREMEKIMAILSDE